VLFAEKVARRLIPDSNELVEEHHLFTSGGGGFGANRAVPRISQNVPPSVDDGFQTNGPLRNPGRHERPR
jgi:hypothetical protein